MQTLILGATGIVGGHIVLQLARKGEQPFALSRNGHAKQSGVRWLAGDLEHSDDLSLPSCDVVFSTVHPALACKAFSKITSPGLRRWVQFTSSSINTKLETGSTSEKASLRTLFDGEAALVAQCERADIPWTILRPTMIYDEGRDANISKLYRLIGRLGFIPLAGRGDGLRQPVHAEDLAAGAIAASGSDAAANKRYILPGAETLSYREMVGRVFDGMELQRRIVIAPPLIWRIGFALLNPFFPGANAEMGARMSQDMVFDATAAKTDFGWTPRPFRPNFTRLRLGDE
jgi:nucleoside-diphosphate-sugar epimerase